METNELETATLAGGCFWCLEAVFERLEGVEGVESGFAGGHVHDPTYQAVCSGTTGHAEVIQVRFHPGVLSYPELLEVFFTIHDPSQLNRQGGDVGSQYRSEIFIHSENQRLVAKERIEKLENSASWDDPIVTQVTELETFYAAEQYHRGYYDRNPEQPYCRLVINPKLAMLRERFASRLRR